MEERERLYTRETKETGRINVRFRDEDQALLAIMHLGSGNGCTISDSFSLFSTGCPFSSTHTFSVST